MNHFKTIFRTYLHAMYQRRRFAAGARKYALGKYKKAPTSTYKRRKLYKPPYARLPYFPPYLMDVPPVKFAKLNYVAMYDTAGPGLNAIVVKEFRINGMFDPDAQIGGHQPMGFDELMKQYEKFTVLKAYVELENMSVVSYKSIFMMLMREQSPGDVAAQFSSEGIAGVLERPGHSETLCVTTGEYQGSKRKVGLMCDMAKYSGKNYKDLIGDYGYQGDVGHDPDQQQFVAVVLFNPTGADQSANTAQWKIKITYYAAFTKRMPPEGS